MRRSLVLTDETARHPFRATLPPHVRAEGIDARVPWREQLWRDAQGFAQAYVVCLLAISIFLF